MKMTNKTYDTIKLIALLFVPISTFIASLVSIFKVPNADIVTAVLGAIDTLIGSLVVIAKQMYDKEQGNGNSNE